MGNSKSVPEKASARKPLTKRVRFNVFKRDLFACQYCGKTPPGVVLEVDHIVPVAAGGGNGHENLITACFDCNRGKGAERLDVAPDSISAKAEVLAEKHAQIKAFNALRKKMARLQDEAVDEVEQVFQTTFPKLVFAAKFRESVKMFIDRIGIDAVCWAMSRACGKCRNGDDATKYFCGICWGKIREPQSSREVTRRKGRGIA